MSSAPPGRSGSAMGTRLNDSSMVAHLQTRLATHCIVAVGEFDGDGDGAVMRRLVAWWRGDTGTGTEAGTGTR